MWRLAERGLRRVLTSALALGAILLVTFALSQAAPGKLSDEWRLDPGMAPETVAAAERRSGAGPVSVVAWTAGLWRADLGVSAVSGVPVADLLATRIANTLTLSVPAMLLAWGAAMLIVRGRPRRDTIGASGKGDALVALLHGVPDVVIAVCLVRLALTTGWFPVGGMGDADTLSGSALLWERATHAVLPVVGLGLTLIPMVAWSVEAALAATRESLALDAARARGLDDGAIVRHEFRMALPAIAPLLGVSTTSLLGAGVVFEVVFAWPGVGMLLVEAVLARDFPVVFGAVAASALLLVVSSVAADAVAFLADPRRR